VPGVLDVKAPLLPQKTRQKGRTQKDTKPNTEFAENVRTDRGRLHGSLLPRFFHAAFGFSSQSFW